MTDIEHAGKLRLLLDQFKDAIEDAKNAGLKVEVTALDDVEVVVSSIAVSIRREF